MILHQEVCELLVWWLGKYSILPKIRCQIFVSLGEVSKGGGSTCGRGVAIINTRHLKQFFRNWSADNACSPWSRNQTHQNTTTSSGHLAGNSVGLSNLVTPITSPHGPM